MKPFILLQHLFYFIAYETSPLLMLQVSDSVRTRLIKISKTTKVT